MWEYTRTYVDRATYVITNSDLWLAYTYDELKSFHRIAYGEEPNWLDKIGYWFGTTK